MDFTIYRYKSHQNEFIREKLNFFEFKGKKMNKSSFDIYVIYKFDDPNNNIRAIRIKNNLK